MKKAFLSLIVISLIFFIGCANHNPNRTYSAKGVIEKIHSHSLKTQGGTEIKIFISCNEVKTKLLKWKEKTIVSDSLTENTYQTQNWFFYPVEQIPDYFEGKKIELTYRIVHFKNPTVVYVVETREIKN